MRFYANFIFVIKEIYGKYPPYKIAKIARW